MEARKLAYVVALVSLLGSLAEAGSYRTENFIVTAKSRPLAKEIAEAAEHYRRELALSWLGRTLPRWSSPCPIVATVDRRLGAGGATSFVFEQKIGPHTQHRPRGDGLFVAQPVGRPYGWEMEIQGSRERVLDSVLPHEVTHTIFATHFGRPLPRWADEGACTTVEHNSEKQKQHRMLYDFLHHGRGIAFNTMFAMTEYPDDILPLYAQGYSLARYLIAQGGRRKFIRYVEQGLDSNNWTVATRNHYGFRDLSDLQVTWQEWVRRGSRIAPSGNLEVGRRGTLLASQTPQRQPEQLPVSHASSNHGASGSHTSGQRLAARATPRQQTVASDGWYARRSRDARPNAPAKPASWQRGLPPTAPSDTKADSWARSQAAGRFANATTKSVPGNAFAARNVADRNAGGLRASKQTLARPKPAAGKREVLLEWGTPTPKLGGSVASRPTQSRW